MDGQREVEERSKEDDESNLRQCTNLLIKNILVTRKFMSNRVNFLMKIYKNKVQESNDENDENKIMKMSKKSRRVYFVRVNMRCLFR